MKTCRLTVLVAGLILMLGAAPSWGQDPSGNDISDSNDNTAGGTGAMQVGGGTFNTAYGHAALNQNLNGILNSAFGQGALQANLFGIENTAVGAGALTNNIGPRACSNCGNNNTALGFQAMFTNGSSAGNGGSFNVAVGNNALFSADGVAELQDAISNTAVGSNAMQNSTCGSFNTAVGDSALINLKNGSGGCGNGNLALGLSAGSNLTTGTGNIYLGSQGGAATENNTMRLGVSGSTNRVFVAGVYSAHATARQVSVNSNGQLGTLASSARYKQDIETMGERSRGLLKLRPVTFHYKFEPHGDCSTA